MDASLLCGFCWVVTSSLQSLRQTSKKFFFLIWTLFRTKCLKNTQIFLVRNIPFQQKSLRPSSKRFFVGCGLVEAKNVFFSFQSEKILPEYSTQDFSAEMEYFVQGKFGCFPGILFEKVSKSRKKNFLKSAVNFVMNLEQPNKSHKGAKYPQEEP